MDQLNLWIPSEQEEVELELNVELWCRLGRLAINQNTPPMFKVALYSFAVVRCGSSSLRRGTLQTPRHLKAGEGIPRSSLARFRSPPRRIMPHRIQSRNRLPCPRVIEGHVELNAGCFGRTQQSQTSGLTHVQDAYVPTGCAGELRSRLLDTILHCDVPGDR